ncbi:MAG TPA: peptidoglycan-binding domain-containing protein [Solirubrobacterales bacterium]|nr:peptidoglycan-binding domain-containing protein [Solirubrobacterales bacterium]
MRHPPIATRQRRRCVVACLVALFLALIALPAGAAAETGGAGSFESAAPSPGPGVGRHSPFARQGMWIWYVDQSQGGSIPAIVATARRHGIGTVYVKTGDGTTPWDQFDRPLVEELHRGGLKVCAWQFVYGDAPVTEAQIGAAAVADGADCLVIDAESDYEGKYAAADLYLDTLRAAIGADFPLSLAGFPYVDYHPAFPYSVFLGPGGANVNQPQMYWKAIGTSVRQVFEHTYLYNRVWGRPIFPIGQTYEAPGRGPLRLFRRYSASYGAAPSWWDWQETTTPEWGALGARVGARKLPGVHPEVEYPLLKIGAKGDLVVWAQERLITAGEELEVNGIFNQAPRRAVRAFQEAHGLPGDGQLGSETWAKLMAYAPFKVEWGASTSTASSLVRGARPGLARKPLSADLPPRRDELVPASCSLCRDIGHKEQLGERRTN